VVRIAPGTHDHKESSKMIAMPMALLLGLGIWISLSKGKGTPWFGFLCVTLGIVIANTDLGRALSSVVESAVSAAVAAGRGINGG
jgi:hypothetical protein